VAENQREKRQTEETGVDERLARHRGPKSQWTVCDRAAPLLARRNSGNENLRPETFGETRRELSSRSGRETAETIAPRAEYGNLALIRALGNRVGLRGFEPRCSWRCILSLKGLFHLRI